MSATGVVTALVIGDVVWHLAISSYETRRQLQRDRFDRYELQIQDEPDTPPLFVISLAELPDVIDANDGHIHLTPTGHGPTVVVTYTPYTPTRRNP